MTVVTPEPSDSWQLRIDGSPRLVSASGAKVELERRDAAVLAYVALEGPTARERLLSLLWPAEPASSVRSRLRQRVYSLKRKLGVEPLDGTLTLALGSAIRWAGLAIEADDRLPFAHDDLQDLPELAHWLVALRVRQHSLQCDRLADQASALEREGRLAEAIVLAERLTVLSPLQEHGHRRRMRLHYLRGDRAAALAAFDHCERVLKDEVGTRPSTETIALLAQIEASAVLAEAAVHYAVPATVQRPPRLVGRDAEWRRLQAAWEAAKAVVVTGEAGLGKSRLLSDLAAARGGALGRVVMVCGRPGDERVPYAVLARLLRSLLDRGNGVTPAPWVGKELGRLLPELDAAPSGSAQAEPARLARAVEHLLAQSRDDGLEAVVLDDLHFCDAASIEIAQQLAAGSTGVRWLVAMRGAEVGADVHAFVDELVANAQAETLVLKPLGVDQIVDLLDSLQIPDMEGGSLAAALHQRTGGNLLYLLETLKAMLQRDGPRGSGPDAPAGGLGRLPTAPNVGRLIEQGLNRLSPMALRLVRCAAISGTDFCAALAAQVLGVSPLDLTDAWAELESAQVLREGAFAHDLVFEAALSSVPSAIAVAFHAEVAAWLQAHGGDPVRVAHHWQEARQWKAAAQAWTEAAQRCAAHGRRVEQARCLAQAAACHGSAQDPVRRVQMLLDRAEVLVQYESADQSRAAFEELEREAQTPAQRLRLTILHMAFANLVGEFDVTQGLAPGAVDLAKALGDDEAVFIVTMQWCGALTKHYRAEEALVRMRALRPWVDERGTLSHKYEYWNGLALALDFDNRLGESLPAWQASIDAAEAMDSDLLPQAINNVGYTCAKMGQHERAVDHARRALTLSRSRSDEFDATGLGPIIRFALGHHLRNLGRYREAIELMDDATQGFVAGRSPMLLASVNHQMALLWVQLGQAARAQPLVAADVPEQTAVQQAQRLAFRAMVWEAQGRPAVDEIRRALALVPNPDSLAHRMWTLAATTLVEPQEGESLACGLAVWAAARERLGLALAAHGRAARCAWAQESWARAVPHVDEALRLSRDVQPDLYYLPELWLVAAQVYGAAGREEDRLIALRTGCEWVLRVAREHVPDAFRQSFLHRNPVNSQLLQWAAEGSVPA
jgi:DNA-binding SARP family transcriptional activator/tetratricopeptide (TPR) repeat protein